MFLGLREADRLELEAAGSDPLEAITRSLADSDEAYTVCLDGEAFCVFGIEQSEFPDCACVWLLSTDELVNHRVSFVRHSFDILEQWNRRYRVLFNAVHEDNSLHRRWLRWVGFREGEPILRGQGARFIPVCRFHV